MTALQGLRFALILFISASTPSHLSAAMLPDALGDPISRPVLIGGGGLITRYAIRGEIVFVADGYSGLSVYSIRDPDRPRLIAEFDTGEYTSGVLIHRNRAFVTDSLNGTIPFDISDPAHPRRLDESDLSGLASAFLPSANADSQRPKCLTCLVDGRIFIAPEGLGVAVIKLRDPPDAQPPVSRTTHVDGLLVPVFQGPALNRSAAGIQATGFAVDAATPLVLDTDPTPLIKAPITPLAAAPELAASWVDGVVILRIWGPRGANVRVQRSVSLPGQWTDWQAVTLGQAPTELRDDDAARGVEFFYRVVMQ